MSRDTQEEKQPIPEKWRVSTDARDARAFSLLQESDSSQLTLKEQLEKTYAVETPKSRLRAKAAITIEALENTSLIKGLTDSQREQLAEAYAEVGFFDKARDFAVSDLTRSEYVKYWQAVWLDDDQWCAHSDTHKYIKDYVYSVRDEKEMPLLACNVCRTFNVVDAPEHLLAAQRKRTSIRNQTRGMSMKEVERFLKGG